MGTTKEEKRERCKGQGLKHRQRKHNSRMVSETSLTMPVAPQRHRESQEMPTTSVCIAERLEALSSPPSSSSKFLLLKDQIGQGQEELSEVTPQLCGALSGGGEGSTWRGPGISRAGIRSCGQEHSGLLPAPETLRIFKLTLELSVTGTLKCGSKRTVKVQRRPNHSLSLPRRFWGMCLQLKKEDGGNGKSFE